MKKSEFILAGKDYETIAAIIEKIGKSLFEKDTDNGECYISSKGKFFEEFLEIEVFYEWCMNNYDCEVVSEVYKIKYEDLDSYLD